LDLRSLGLEPVVIDTIHELLFIEESNKPHQAHPSQAYISDTKAMESTPADVKEYPDSYVYVIEMPGIKTDQIKVQVEDNMLVVIGERREKEEGVKYVKME
ncbi:HSP20 domain-containing protein, partial [Cephalotus follicularis]